MADKGATIRLFSWLSPAFPIGGFAYSQGLETAIAEGRVADGVAVAAWIGGQMRAGTIRTDAFFFGIAHRAVAAGDAAGLRAANALALALQASAERDAETREQARSFLEGVRAWAEPVPQWLAPILEAPLALPIAFGAIAGLHAIAAGTALMGFINAFAGQQISVAVRLVPLGQSEGLRLLAGLEPEIAALAEVAESARLEDVAGIPYGADIAAMRHETLATRIFRS